MSARSFPRSQPRRAALLCTVTLALLATGASAQVSQPAKIAVVNLDRVFLESTAGGELQAELQTLNESLQKTIGEMQERAEGLQASATGKSVEEQTQIQREIEDLDREARRLRENAQRQATTLEQEKRAAFQEQVQPIFAEIQQAQGFDLILNMNRAIVVFAGPRIDITDEIVAKLGAPAPAPGE